MRFKYLPFELLKRVSNAIEFSPALYRCLIKLVFFFATTFSFVSRRYRELKVISLVGLIISPGGRTCHIFGNGRSVIRTMAQVSRDDYVIKINSGGIIPTHTNLWITELPHKKQMNPAELAANIEATKTLMCYVLRTSPDAMVLIKNVWFNSISCKLYDPHFQYYYLRDFLLRLEPRTPELRRMIVQEALTSKLEIIGQISSSILTAMNIAFRLGFEKIVVHGLDGEGSHFFHDQIFDHGFACTDLIQYFRGTSPPRAEGEIYDPGKNSMAFVSDFVSVLRSKGVDVRFA